MLQTLFYYLPYPRKLIESVCMRTIGNPKATIRPLLEAMSSFLMKNDQCPCFYSNVLLLTAVRNPITRWTKTRSPWERQGWQYGTLVRYGTPQFLVRSTVRFFCNGTGTVRWYGTLFRKGTGTIRWSAVKIKTRRLFAHCAGFFVHRGKKAAETDAKCLNWNRWYIG